MKKDLVIIGGGPAGMAAAVSAFDNGITDLVVIERDVKLGGILGQCIHNGFGLTRFGENMTGPEYAAKYLGEVKKRGIEIMTETMVLGVSDNKIVTATNSARGIFSIEAKAVILAMGCRERSRGALNIAGYRPAGILSAGTAQKYVNIEGKKIGKNIVILGSGDIGLIMARRMTLERARVHAVCEIMPYSSGLRRNIVQCLDDFEIPLYLSHTIVYIHGKERVEGVTIAKVDENRKPIKESEKFIKCDTVLFSVGLIPENELTRGAGIEISPKTRGAVVDEGRGTEKEGIFACGNVLHVHDLVDFVSEEAEIAGAAAARYIKGGAARNGYASVGAGRGVAYVVPQKISKGAKDPVKLFFRPDNCYKNVTVRISGESGELLKKKKVAAAPGEMETVTLTPEKIADAGESITVSIEGEKAL